MAATVANALAYATTAHAGQVDKAGAPYIDHVIRVAAAARKRALHASSVDNLSLRPDEVEMAGLLHDVIEDTPSTPGDLRVAGFSFEVIATVLAVTKEQDQRTYGERIEALAAHGSLAAILVKIADNEDNLRPDRRTPGDESRRERYRRSLAVLVSAARARGYTDH